MILYCSFFVFVTILIEQSSTNPVAVEVHDCPAVLKAAGASNDFASHAGHAVHAFTVQDLRKFEPTVTEQNSVPTVNRDMLAAHAVLSYAPDFKSADNDRFLSDIMKILDVVLTHMDDPTYFRRYVSTVELVAHEAHMHELWAHVRVEYEKLRKQPPHDADNVCACALDLEQNGMKRVLQNAAMIIREPKLTVGYDPSNFTLGDLRYYMLYMVVMYPQTIDAKLFEKPPGYELTGSRAWDYFKKANPPNTAHFYDAALFLHCALKRERELVS